MTKKELVEKVSGKTELSVEKVSAVINAAFSAITAELCKDHKVQLIGFGTFEVKTRAGRKGRNPRTGEEIELPPSRLPYFKAGKALKEAVNE